MILLTKLNPKSLTRILKASRCCLAFGAHSSNSTCFGSVPRLQMPLTHSGVNEPEM